MNARCRACIAARAMARIGGGTTETLRDLIGRKIVGDVDFDQGILGLGTY